VLPAAARTLPRAFEARQSSDYADSSDPTEEAVRALRIDVETFVTSCERIVEETTTPGTADHVGAERQTVVRRQHVPLVPERVDALPSSKPQWRCVVRMLDRRSRRAAGGECAIFFFAQDQGGVMDDAMAGSRPSRGSLMMTRRRTWASQYQSTTFEGRDQFWISGWTAWMTSTPSVPRSCSSSSPSCSCIAAEIVPAAAGRGVTA
jgi:hypothetical protein